MNRSMRAAGRSPRARCDLAGASAIRYGEMPEFTRRIEDAKRSWPTSKRASDS